MGGCRPQAQPGNKEGIGLARWFGKGFPATVPAIFQVPRGSTAGVVRICARGAWLGILCGFLPGQTNPEALVDCRLRWAPQAALTLAHCSSSAGNSGALTPLPAPSDPHRASATLPMGSRSWAHCCHLSGCHRVGVLNKSLSCLGDIPSSRDQHSML